jgi:hypothetical protein
MMNYGLRIATLVVILSMSGTLVRAEETDSSALAQMAVTEKGNSASKTETSQLGISSSNSALRFSGYASMMFGQMVDYWLVNDNIPRQDLLQTYVNLGVSKQATDRLQFQAFIEGKMYFNTFGKANSQSVEAFVLPTMYYSFYLDRAFCSYSLGDVESPYLQFTLGYFPYKYNPEVRDLGEYLYRSGTYPAYLVNQFDYPQARLAGLKVSSDLFGMLHQDLLLTTGVDAPPYFDLSLGYVVSADFGKILNIGIGGMYQSLIPASDQVTSPHADPTTDKQNAYIKDSVALPGGTYQYDTAFYTYAGLKLMARLSFDPKRIFVHSDDEGVLGPEDCKLYGEIAILGVENYPASTIIYNIGSTNPYGYDTLMHKMPIMVGFNFPTFRLLDVLTGEVEWYGCTYPDAYEYKGESPQIYPIPMQPGNQTGSPGDAHTYAALDNWKWAVYAKKTFKNGIFLVGQIATDHIRNETPIASSVDLLEALRTDRGYWWALKLGYKF